MIRLGAAPKIMGIKTSVFFDQAAIKRRIAPGRLKFLRYWGGWVRRTARNLIKRKGAARKAPKRKYKGEGETTWTDAYRRWWAEVQDQPSSPAGSPPYTHTNLLREAILYAFDTARETAVVGPSERIISDIGALHEHGGTRFGKDYPARPYMVPARERSYEHLDEFARRAF